MPKRSRVFESRLRKATVIVFSGFRNDAGPENEKSLNDSFFILKKSCRQIRKSTKTQCHVKIINSIQNNYFEKKYIELVSS